jgi:hypothetical protein
MKRILVAFNGLRLSSGSIAYAIYLARKLRSPLTGVFLREMHYYGDAYNYGFGEPYIDFDNLERDNAEDEKFRKENISFFLSQCKDNGIEASVHNDKGTAARELIYESAFADIVLIGSETSFFEVYSDLPGSFLHDILVDSHCPVMTVPEIHTEIKNIILAYDGSPVSLYAIKMFGYIFGELDFNILVVSSYSEKEGHAASKNNLEEFLRMRFKNYTIQKIKHDSSDALFSFLDKNKENSMVVMGSYGRNAISRFIHKSTADKVIRDAKIPVFISHY